MELIRKSPFITMEDFLPVIRLSPVIPLTVPHPGKHFLEHALVGTDTFA